MRPSCWHQNFGTNGLSAPAQGLCTCIKLWKKVHEIREKSYFFKHATSDQSDKTFLHPSKTLSRMVVSSCRGAIWAPSNEFVSSSIPSWQILTAHAQPFRGARVLAFCLKVPLDSLLVWASSVGSGEAKGIFLELVLNDGNNKSFKMLPELVPNGCMPMPWPFFFFFFFKWWHWIDLDHFYDRSDLFPDASVWVTAYTALSAHGFPSLF